MNLWSDDRRCNTTRYELVRSRKALYAFILGFLSEAAASTMPQESGDLSYQIPQVTQFVAGLGKTGAAVTLLS
ncbi:hypothetical protein MyChFU_36150 [Mycobacterium intracellulare subsp. chimaera]